MCEDHRGGVGMPTVLAESGDRKEPESKARDRRFVALVKPVWEEGRVRVLDLRFMSAILASICLCMNLVTARLRRAVMGWALAICCRTVMKKWVSLSRML